MNIMTDIWVTFGVDGGQIVESAYRYDYDTDSVIRRWYDRSDMTTTYYRAACPVECEWNGSEGDHDCRDLDFVEIDGNPFRD